MPQTIAAKHGMTEEERKAWIGWSPTPRDEFERKRRRRGNPLVIRAEAKIVVPVVKFRNMPTRR